MPSLRDKQIETFANISTAMAMMNTLPDILDFLSSPSVPNLALYGNPLEYLMALLKALGIKRETLRDFLSVFLTATLPALELGVKAILLANIKELVGCANDPRIPDKYRKARIEGDAGNNYGITVPISSIDYANKLSYSPLSKEGDNMYFGVKGVRSAFQFARADDFDAFLWFVKTKGRFPSSTTITSATSGDVTDFFRETFSATSVAVTHESRKRSTPTLLNDITVNFNTNNPSRILPGNTFSYGAADSSTFGSVAMCVQCFTESIRKRGNGDTTNTDVVVQNEIIPISNDYKSVNWYVRPADYFTRNMLSKQKPKARNYAKERGICNVEYIKNATGKSADDTEVIEPVGRAFLFSILPKPFVKIPNISKMEPIWRWKKILFNSDGEPDSSGHFSIPLTTQVIDGDGKAEFRFKGEKLFDMHYVSGKIDNISPNLYKYLLEVYPGLTLYEFNYDFIMGMRLFDAKELTGAILNTLLGARLGVNLALNTQQIEGEEMIREIVKSIIETDDGSINDCYFTFSNDRYDKLLQRSEDKRYHQQRFGTATYNTSRDSVEELAQLLDEYDADATLHEQQDLLGRVITQAAVAVSNGTEPQVKYSLEYSFLFDFISELTTQIVNAVLSPKILFLFAVNKEMLGSPLHKQTMKELLMSMRKLIITLVQQIAEMVMNEILKLIIKEFLPLVEFVSSMTLQETLNNYKRIIEDILEKCRLGGFSLFRDNLVDTQLDVVDYADIDTGTTGQQIPETKEC